MNIMAYDKCYKDRCIALFESNQDKYFDVSELKDFNEFLTQQVFGINYYVVLDESNVIGCGGFARQNNAVYLRWGMVNRSSHKSGVGKLLLKHRINEIESKFGKVPIKIDTSQFTKGFYEKFGFVVSHEEENGLAAGLTKVSMCYDNYNL